MPVIHLYDGKMGSDHMYGTAVLLGGLAVGRLGSWAAWQLGGLVVWRLLSGGTTTEQVVVCECGPGRWVTARSRGQG